MMKSKIFRIVLTVGVALMIFLFIRNIFRSKIPSLRQRSLCVSTKYAKKEFLNGIIVEKYVDWDNHGDKTILVSSETGENIRSTIFVLEKSGAFEYLNKGDSIVKNGNSLELHIYKSKNKKVFTLNYGCKE